MRFSSSLVLGLSLFTAFAAADVPASSNGVALDTGDLSQGDVVDTREAIAAAIDIDERSLNARDPDPKGPKGPKGSKGKKSATKEKASLTPAKSSLSKVASSVVATTSAKTKSINSSGKTLSTITTSASKTKGQAATSTKSTESATPTILSKRRIKCGAPGSSCTSSNCILARTPDSRKAINRRAWRTNSDSPSALVGKSGNVGLSGEAAVKKDVWIPFEKTFRSVTIEGLTGCTAVIAISEKGMYAFHIWEDREGDSLQPKSYVKALQRIQTKLASKAAELAGGHLYVMFPLNPDQPKKLLYDSTRWNDDLTEEESEADKNKKWTKSVPRVQPTRDAITKGSGLSITKEVIYLPPKAGQSFSRWMTAQFDPEASKDQKAYAVWNSNGQIGRTHQW